jgi:predicted nucleic acid-binding protein
VIKRIPPNYFDSPRSLHLGQFREGRLRLEKCVQDKTQIVDSNILTARSLTSSLISGAKQVEEKGPVWIVPVVRGYEFQNILATAIKAKQIQPEQALDIWENVSKILMENKCEPSASKVIDLVAQYGITAYDRQFIAAALEMRIPFVTEDREQ